MSFGTFYKWFCGRKTPNSRDYAQDCPFPVAKFSHQSNSLIYSKPSYRKTTGPFSTIFVPFVPAVLPRTINIIVCGQCPGWCLSGTRTLSVFMMILYVTMKLTICVELICNRFDTSMSYVSLYIQTAWGRRAIYVSPVHLWWGCCGLALKHPYSVQVVALCLTGTGPPDLSMMTLLHTHKTVYMCSFEMSACVTYECHMQAHKSRWFVAGQQYLHCICDRDTAVLH